MTMPPEIGIENSAQSTTARRSIIIAGAGIGGLSAALALAQRGFPCVILEAASRLEEIGAGIQLSPNATRILIALGLRDALAPYIVAPSSLRVMNGRSGRELARLSFGHATHRNGAPFWVVHRGDLQRVLLNAVHAHPLVNLRLGTAVVGHAAQGDGVMVVGKWRDLRVQENGAALIGADGLQSATRQALGFQAKPRFSGKSAWRATVPLARLPRALIGTETHLWLGPSAHFVHYAIRGGSAVNVVAIIKDRQEHAGWNEPHTSKALLDHIIRWSADMQTLVAEAGQWRVWSLYELPPLPRWGDGPVTLLGDAAHAMLPFIAQGAAMAIEDAWTLATCLADQPEAIVAALRRYEDLRRPRTNRVARAAASIGRVYGLRRPFADARNFVMRMIGDERLRARYDWIYNWRHGEDAAPSAKG
jgi:salicylate hydroxylase